MEASCKEKIQQNLSKLVEYTEISAMFLAAFESNNIFSKTDLQLIESEV